MSTSGFLKDTNEAVDRQDLEMTEDDKKNNKGLQKFLRRSLLRVDPNSLQPYLAMNSSSPLE